MDPRDTIMMDSEGQGITCPERRHGLPDPASNGSTSVKALCHLYLLTARISCASAWTGAAGLLSGWQCLALAWQAGLAGWSAPLRPAARRSQCWLRPALGLQRGENQRCLVVIISPCKPGTDDEALS